MKTISIRLSFLFSFLILFWSCKQEKETVPIGRWSQAHQYYLDHITDAIAYLDTLKNIGHTSKDAKIVFKKARQSFKKAEPFASYLNPKVGHRANGPALPVFKDDNGKVLKPIGLQKIEESIYERNEDSLIFRAEVSITKGLIFNLKKNIEKRKLTAKRFFIATQQQLLRIISFSLSGFDTPVSQMGIQEAGVSLKSLLEVYQMSFQSIIVEKDRALDQDFKTHIDDALAYLNDHPDFIDFNRFEFIRNYMNPITRDWAKMRTASGLWEGAAGSPFNFSAETFFDDDAFDIEFFRQATNSNPTQTQIELGKKLFFDKNLSENKQISCATCHNPKKAYTDGLVTNLSNSGEPLQRNTPTLINAALQQGFFWDGRSATLLDQISSVFLNTSEFNTKVHQFSNNILKDSTYAALFKKAFGGISSRNTDVIKAISAYTTTLTGFNSKFDRNIRAEENTYSKEETLGFNLYMGKALCATCHFIPLTNGTVPPFFSDSEKEVIGVPETSENNRLDDDLGFYWKFNEPLHRGMFKTPTVRNSAVTSPYMHNGVYETLEQVIEFYNLGGGGGLEFENMEHQTLPFDNLELTDAEQNALVVFLKTLTDDNIEGAVY